MRKVFLLALAVLFGAALFAEGSIWDVPSVRISVATNTRTVFAPASSNMFEVTTWLDSHWLDYSNYAVSYYATIRAGTSNDMSALSNQLHIADRVVQSNLSLAVTNLEARVLPGTNIVGATYSSNQWNITAGLAEVPPGAVVPFAMSTPPTGWLACTGGVVSRVTYSNLFAAISTTFGSGDGSSTFGIPDLRDLFVRGYGPTYSTNFGVMQTDAVQRITGTFGAIASSSGRTWPLGVVSHSGVFSGSGSGRDAGNIAGGQNSVGSDTITFDSATAIRSTTNETRPRNMALLYCIKY